MLFTDFNAKAKELVEYAQTCAKTVLEFNPEIVTMAADEDYKSLQQWLEVHFSKPEKLNETVSMIFSDESLNEIYEDVADSVNLSFKLVKKAIAHLALHRRLTKESFFNLMKGYFETDEDICAFFKGLEETEFVDVQGKMYIIPERFTLSEGQESYLDLFQSNPPMIYPPKKVYGTRNGYLNLNRGIFTKKATPHNEVPKDFLNLQNHIPYRINYSVWDNWIKDHPEIPERDRKDDDAKYEKKLKEALRLHFKKAFILNLFKELDINKLYILTQYDYRGRNYAISYLFNPQGTDADKALLAFEPSEITPEGEYWLKISIANCFNCSYQGKSLDKHTFEIRKQWFDTNMEPLFELNTEDFNNKLQELASEAESPACFWSQMNNLYFIVQDHKLGNIPKSWVITHWDATASGYQLQSIFAKDWDMARLTNLVSNRKQERKDVYTELYNQLIAKGIPQKYSRNEVKKKCFIPAVYNSIKSIEELFGSETLEEKIFHEVMNQFKMWRLNRQFPSLWKRSWLEYSFTLPDGFKAYKQIMVDKVATINYEDSDLNLYYKVQKTKEDYEADSKNKKWGSLELGPNMTHACDGLVARELARRMNWNPKWKIWIYLLRQNKDLWTYEEDNSRKTMKNLIALAQRFNFWSVRILKEITPSNIDLIPEEVFTRLYNELPETPTSVSEIHDSFGVHPNKAAELMKQYRLILRDLAKSAYLEEIINELTGEDFEPDIDEQFVDAIMKSTYALC